MGVALGPTVDYPQPTIQPVHPLTHRKMPSSCRRAELAVLKNLRSRPGCPRARARGHPGFYFHHLVCARDLQKDPHAFCETEVPRPPQPEVEVLNLPLGLARGGWWLATWRLVVAKVGASPSRRGRKNP